MMMFETSKHVPKTEKRCCKKIKIKKSVVVFLKIIVSFVLTRTTEFPFLYYYG